MGVEPVPVHPTFKAMDVGVLRTTGSPAGLAEKAATPVPLRKQGMNWILSLSFLAMSWTTEEAPQNHDSAC